MATLTAEMIDNAIAKMINQKPPGEIIIPAPQWVIDKGIKSGDIQQRDGQLYFANTTHKIYPMGTFNGLNS